MRLRAIWNLDPAGNAAKLTDPHGQRGPVELAGFAWLPPESSLVRRSGRFVDPVRLATVAVVVVLIFFFLSPAAALYAALEHGGPSLMGVGFVVVTMVLWIVGIPYACAGFLGGVMRRSVQVQDDAVTCTRSVFRIWAVQRTVPVAEVTVRVHEVALRRAGGLWLGYCLVLTHAEFCMALNRYSSREKAENDVRKLPESLQSRFAGDGVMVTAYIPE
jgi:hypothetical protein